MLRAGAWTHGKWRVRYRRRQTGRPAETDTDKIPSVRDLDPNRQRYVETVKNRHRDKVRDRERQKEGKTEKETDRYDRDRDRGSDMAGVLGEGAERQIETESKRHIA